jgi:hypothetical protein
MAAHPIRRVTVELPEEWVELLAVLGDPAEVLAELASHAWQGVSRPGSWERPWLLQAFGDEFLERLEPDPDVPYRQRRRRP